jgi:hypothetical protein
LLPKCELIHQAVETVTPKDKRSKPEQIRKRVWEIIRKDVHGMRGDDLVFGGQAFSEIPHGKRARVPCLCDRQSWTPRQLAISLLVFERELKYSTLEKKLRSSKTKTTPH